MSHSWRVKLSTTGTITAPVQTTALALRNAQIASHHTTATAEDNQFWTAVIAGLNALFADLDPSGTAEIDVGIHAEGLHAGFSSAACSVTFQLNQPDMSPSDVHHWETEALDHLDAAELILFNSLFSAQLASKGYTNTTQDTVVKDALVDLVGAIKAVLDPSSTAQSFNIHMSASVSVGNLDHVSGTLSVSSVQPGVSSNVVGVPVGGILMWSGTLASIPTGFSLCDGTNGTPDLRDRFIVGAANGQNPGTVGGAATHLHAAHPDHSGVINHTHPVNDPGHTHDQMRHATTTGALTGIVTAPDTSSSSPQIMGPTTGSRTTGVTTQNPAGGVAAYSHSAHDSVSNLPPFYALAFIMRTS